MIVIQFLLTLITQDFQMISEEHRSWVSDQIYQIRFRLKRYLCHANPDRLKHADDILKAYQLSDTETAIAAAMDANLPLAPDGSGTVSFSVGTPNVTLSSVVAGHTPRKIHTTKNDLHCPPGAAFYPLGPPDPRIASTTSPKPARSGASGMQYVPSSDDDEDVDTDDERNAAPWRQRLSPKRRSRQQQQEAIAGANYARELAFKIGVWLDLQTSKMMSDLVAHFHIAEPAAMSVPRGTTRQDEDAFFSKVSNRAPGDYSTDGLQSIRSIFTPASPPSTTAAMHPAVVEHTRRERGPTEPSFVTMGQPTPVQQTWARDHTPYVQGAIRPSGFNRRDALCPICGIEALNPPELQRHLQFKHGHFPTDL